MESGESQENEREPQPLFIEYFISMCYVGFYLLNRLKYLRDAAIAIGCLIDRLTCIHTHPALQKSLFWHLFGAVGLYAIAM
jgi:hypothetical protein